MPKRRRHGELHYLPHSRTRITLDEMKMVSKSSLLKVRQLLFINTTCGQISRDDAPAALMKVQVPRVRGVQKNNSTLVKALQKQPNASLWPDNLNKCVSTFKTLSPKASAQKHWSRVRKLLGAQFQAVEALLCSHPQWSNRVPKPGGEKNERRQKLFNIAYKCLHEVCGFRNTTGLFPAKATNPNWRQFIEEVANKEESKALTQANKDLTKVNAKLTKRVQTLERGKLKAVAETKVAKARAREAKHKLTEAKKREQKAQKQLKHAQEQVEQVQTQVQDMEEENDRLSRENTKQKNHNARLRKNNDKHRQRVHRARQKHANGEQALAELQKVSTQHIQ